MQQPIIVAGNQLGRRGMRVLESPRAGRLAPLGMHGLRPCRQREEGTNELVQNT